MGVIPLYHKKQPGLARMLLPSILSIAICLTTYVGSTWAWFVDSATISVQSIASAEKFYNTFVLTATNFNGDPVQMSFPGDSFEAIAEEQYSLSIMLNCAPYDNCKVLVETMDANDVREIYYTEFTSLEDNTMSFAISLAKDAAVTISLDYSEAADQSWTYFETELNTVVEPIPETCICETPCVYSVNVTCPICLANSEACVKLQELECICTELCGELVNEDCPVCKNGLTCSPVVSEQPQNCTCTVRCDEENHDLLCLICANEPESCEAELQPLEPPVEQPTVPEIPTEPTQPEEPVVPPATEPEDTKPPVSTEPTVPEEPVDPEEPVEPEAEQPSAPPAEEPPAEETPVEETPAETGTEPEIEA